VIEVPSLWFFNGGWAKFEFRDWSTGEASTTIAIDVRGDTSLTARYRDWRKLKVTYTSGGYVEVKRPTGEQRVNRLVPLRHKRDAGGGAEQRLPLRGSLRHALAKNFLFLSRAASRASQHLAQ